VHENVDVKEFRKLFACISYEMYQIHDFYINDEKCSSLKLSFSLVRLRGIMHLVEAHRPNVGLLHFSYSFTLYCSFLFVLFPYIINRFWFSGTSISVMLTFCSITEFGLKILFGIIHMFISTAGDLINVLL
jgi:hypothetical protein